MKPGRALEQLVTAIQDYLKDNKDTVITPNAKLLNRSGVEREIDVYVQTKVQGMDIGIAFECKDYTTKVGVEKIDAFAQKCRELTQIHKKVLVSSIGYTKGALKEAQSQGIELYQLSKVPFNCIFAPYDIYHTKCVVHMPSIWQMSVIDNANPKLFRPHAPVYLSKNDSIINETDYILSMIRMYFPSIISEAHSILQSGQECTHDLPLEIKTQKSMYIVDIFGEKHIVDRIFITVNVSLSSQIHHASNQNIYNSLSNTISPVRITEYKRDKESLILVEGNKTSYEAYIKDLNGNIQKTILYPKIQ